MRSSTALVDSTGEACFVANRCTSAAAPQLARSRDINAAARDDRVAQATYAGASPDNVRVYALLNLIPLGIRQLDGTNKLIGVNRLRAEFLLQAEILLGDGHVACDLLGNKVAKPMFLRPRMDT